jgi:hypothetical protein
MESRPNLILGLCAGYGLAGAEVLVRSFRRNVASAALHLLVKDIGADLAAFLAAEGVGTTDCAPFLELTAELGINIYSSRHFLLRRFLRRHTGHARVMLTDVRDVLFQSDPFRLPFPSEVVFAAEDKRIQDCATNSSWIRHAYGEEILDAVRTQAVTCAGTVFGSHAGVLRYLDLMCAQVRRRPQEDGDQGLHNVLAWGLRPAGMAVDLADSIVATLDGTPAERVAFRDGLVFVDGRVPAVVHQWDRQDALRGPVMQTWRRPAG